MPTYLYKCKTCGNEFQYQQRITEEALTNCPADLCKGDEKGEGEVFRKISSNVGLVFNGSGFYLTDYKNKHSSSSSAGTESSSTSESASAGTTCCGGSCSHSTVKSDTNAA